MSIITLWNVNTLSISKELYESILISPKLWLMLSVLQLFSLIRYLISSQILSNNLLANNTKCLNSSQQNLINRSILWSLICTGLGPVEGLHEMS